MRHAIPRRETNAQKKRGTVSIIWRHIPEYLDKEVYESQWNYDNQEDGCAGNDNYQCGEGNKDGAQEHEYGAWEGLIYDVDVLREAVDDASYRRSIKERLGCVKFVDKQVMMQLPCCTDVTHGQCEGRHHDQDTCGGVEPEQQERKKKKEEKIGEDGLFREGK